MSSEPNVDVVEGTSFHLEPRQKLEILFAILLALFLFALDQTVVGTALPVIVTDLQGEDLYTWTVTIYLLTATSLVHSMRTDAATVLAFGRRALGRTGARPAESPSA